MIHQIQPVKTKTSHLPAVNQGLVQARRIQARLKGTVLATGTMGESFSWSPFTAGPYLVPLSRRVE